MSRKLDEIKRRLDSQILTAIIINITAITEKVILWLQESIETLENRITARLDLQSAGLDRNTGGTDMGKVASKLTKTKKMQILLTVAFGAALLSLKQMYMVTTW